MAITIDLLPGYVGLNRLFKRLVVVSVLLLAITGGVLYSLYYKNQQLLEKYNQERAAIESYASQAGQVQQEADAATAAAAPILSAVTFMADASKTGPQRAALLNLIRNYIYYRPGRGAVVTLMDLSDGQNLKLTATMDTTQDFNAFLYTLRSGSATRTPPGPLFSADASASGIPGFPPPPPGAGTQGQGTTPGATGAQAGVPLPGEPYVKVFRFNINAQAPLKNPIALPADPGGDVPTGAAAGGAGGGGYPGGSGGSSYPGSGT